MAAKRLPRLAPAAALATLATAAWVAPLGAQMKTVSWSRQASIEDELEVRVTFGAGELWIGRAERGELYRARLDYDEAVFSPEHDYDDGELHVGLSGAANKRLGRHNASSLELWLSPDVPQGLQLDFGAGAADVDLSGVPLYRLEINTGASESSIRIDEPNPVAMDHAEIGVGAAELSIHGLGNLKADQVTVAAGLGAVTLGLQGDWPDDAQLDIEMGLGSLTIEAPESLGVRIHRQNFLASIQADGFVRSGRTHRSANWESAERRVDIDLQAALGSIEVIWVRQGR